MPQMVAFGAVVVAQAADGGGSSNPLGFIVPLVVLGGLFYVFLVLPQRRRVKHMQQLRESLTTGDRVRTVGGIFGRITGEDDEAFLLDVGGGTTLRIAKRAIAEKVEDES